MHMVRNKILVVAADSYSPQQLAAVRDGKEPRIDFLEAAQVMGADLLTFDSLRHSSAGGASGETPEMDYEHIKHPNPWLAPRPEKLRRALRLMMDLTKYAYELADRYDAILLTGEDLGIPLAMRYRQNARRARIVMIAHYLNPLKKQLFLKFSRLGKFIQKVVTYSPAQHLFCLERLGFPEGRIELIPFHADTRFYCPAEVEREPDLLVSAGFERRDYAALFDAIRGTSFRLELGVGSPWSRFRKSLPPLPPNTVNRYRSRLELRDLYRRTGAMAISLVDTEFQAGISVILESMSCGAPMVLSRTRGLAHLLQDEREGLYTPPGDAAAMRRAFERLRGDRELADRLGCAARVKVEEMMSTTHFVMRLERICEAARKDSASPEFYLVPSLLSTHSPEAES